MMKKTRNALWGMIAALVLLVVVAFVFSTGSDVAPAQSFSGGGGAAVSELTP